MPYDMSAHMFSVDQKLYSQDTPELFNSNCLIKVGFYNNFWIIVVAPPNVTVDS